MNELSSTTAPRARIAVAVGAAAEAAEAAVAMGAA